MAKPYSATTGRMSNLLIRTAPFIRAWPKVSVVTLYLHTDFLHSLQYSLPANSSIYLRSNFSDLDEEPQSQVTGSALVSITTNATEKNAIVSVNMKDIGEEPLSLASVCLMKASDGWGLAIYVRIIFPSTPLQLNSLS